MKKKTDRKKASIIDYKLLLAPMLVIIQVPFSTATGSNKCIHSETVQQKEKTG